MEAGAVSQFLFRHRSLWVLALVAPLAIAALRGGGVDARMAALGACVAAAGVALRLAAMRQIGRGARVHRPHASAGLVADGPYRWSRNPLYIAAALILCGLGFVAGMGAPALWLLPATALVYTPVVLTEERALAAQLGEPYLRYRARVPRWLGWPHPPEVASEGAPTPWPEVARREKRLVPGTLAAAAGVAALRAEWLPFAGWARALGDASGLGVAGLVVGAIAVAAVLQGLKMERRHRRREAQRAASAAGR